MLQMTKSTAMKTILRSAFWLIPSLAFAQGSLTPPGPPAPAMKTLVEIEPRTPISSAPFTITNSGSYYLTTNLNVSTGNGITIATNGVTLDLSGFTISSTASNSATPYGILLNSGLSDITIFNGHIRGGVTTTAPGFTAAAAFCMASSTKPCRPSMFASRGYRFPAVCITAFGWLLEIRPWWKPAPCGRWVALDTVSGLRR
jgi:hypothetical protein